MKDTETTERLEERVLATTKKINRHNPQRQTKSKIKEERPPKKNNAFLSIKITKGLKFQKA